MRAGVIRKGLMALSDHPIFSQWIKDNRHLDGYKMNFLGDWLLGIGKKQNKKAWWFAQCTQQPTPREVAIVIKTFSQFFLDPTPPPICYSGYTI